MATLHDFAPIVNLDDTTDHALPEPVSAADRQWWAAQNADWHAEETLGDTVGYTDYDCTSWWEEVDADRAYQAECERYLARRSRVTRVDAEDEARMFGWIR